MLQTMAPTREELVQRAAELVLLLRDRARWIDDHRRPPEDVVEALQDSGLLKMRIPTQYGGYESDARTLVDVHAELGEASLLAEEAETRIHRFADLIAAKTAVNEPWTEAERVRSRVLMGRVAQLAKQAVDIIGMASGASSIYADVPIQRIQRDMHALTIHALTNPDTNIELYGRQLCGLPPNTPYL